MARLRLRALSGVFALSGVLALTMLLAGCVVGPAYRAPLNTLPERWNASAAAAAGGSAAALKDFWAGFDDPILAQLIQQAIQGNFDLKVAGERVQSAYELVSVAGAAGLPQVGVGAAAESRRETQTIDWPPASPRYGEYPYYALGFDASWELDLFGEVHRRKQAAQALAEAATESRRGMLISLTAAVADTYLSLRTTQLRLQIARASLASAQQTQRLVHHAFAAGERSHLDVSEADGRVHGFEATLAPLQAHADDLLHALAVLLGEAPVQLAAGAFAGEPVLPEPPRLPPSLPSEVIAQRPDIRRAEREYAKSNAQLGVAMAAVYPHFSIPLSINPTTSAVHEIFQSASLLWRLGLDATQSVYSGGRLTANIRAARAQRQAALYSYRQTVLTAFGEVEDALSNRAAEQVHYQALSAELADNRQALQEARQRYENGQEGLLPVLDDQELLYASQDALANSALSRCLADIALFKALGGDWQAVTLRRVAENSAANGVANGPASR